MYNEEINKLREAKNKLQAEGTMDVEGQSSDTSIQLSAVDEQIKWIEKNQDAEAEDYKTHKKELEEIVQPIISKLYQGAPPPEGGAPGGEEEKDEL